MRRPVNAPYTITTEFGVKDSYALFGRHSGVDYAVPKGRPVYAPASGTVQNVVSDTGGNMVVIFDGQFYHRLMHNSSFSVKNGSRVVEGQEVAKAGSTGLSTGPHVHWDINTRGVTATAFSQFIPPADWLAGKYKKPSAPAQGGNQVFNNEAEVQEAYLLLRGKKGTSAEAKSWIGQPKQRFFQVGKAEADNYRKHTAAVEKQLADVKKALENEKAKPPKEIVKVVEKIVEKPVPTGGVDESMRTDISAIRATVDWIKALLTKVFKG